MNALAEDLGLVPSTHWLTTVYNYSSKAPECLYLALLPLNAHTMHTYLCRQNTNTHELNKSTKKISN